MNKYVYPADITYLVLARDVILAGGALRALFTGETPSDYDLFFTSGEQVTETNAFLQSQGYELVFACPEGMLTTWRKGEIKVQCITERLWTHGWEVIQSFDIVAGMAYLSSFGDVVCHPGFPAAIANKLITFHLITYPVSTLMRVAKYVDKGYRLRGDAAEWLVYRIRTMSTNATTMRHYID